MNPRTLRDSCCARLGIPPESFEQTMLWRCVPFGHVAVGKLCWRINRRCFQPDMELIHAVATCTSMQDVYAELSDFHYRHPNRGFVRKVLKVRVSGRCLVRFASKFLRS